METKDGKLLQDSAEVVKPGSMNTVSMSTNDWLTGLANEIISDSVDSSTSQNR